MPKPDVAPLFCDRCLVELNPGRGGHFQVRIEAVADPAAPVFTADDLAKDPRAEWSSLMAKLGDLSEREAMDHVHRRVTLYLCNRCYRRWIENPTAGRTDESPE